MDLGAAVGRDCERRVRAGSGVRGTRPYATYTYELAGSLHGVSEPTLRGARLYTHVRFTQQSMKQMLSHYCTLILLRTH